MLTAEDKQRISAPMLAAITYARRVLELTGYESQVRASVDADAGRGTLEVCADGVACYVLTIDVSTAEVSAVTGRWQGAALRQIGLGAIADQAEEAQARSRT